MRRTVRVLKAADTQINLIVVGVRAFALVACLFRSSRGKVKNALYYSVVKEQQAAEKPPHLSKGKNEGAAHPEILNFQ